MIYSKIESSKKYYASLSYLRIFACACIITCHVLQYYGMYLAWWLNVGVQIFLILSGFLVSQTNIDNVGAFYSKRLFKVLIPFYIYILVLIPVYFVFNRDAISFLNIIKLLLCVGTIQGLEHLWFVGYIVFCYLISPVLFTIFNWLTSKKNLIKVLLFAFLLSIFIAFGYLTNFYFNPLRIVCFIGGFAIGFLFKNREHLIIKIICLCTVIIAFLLCLLRVFLDFDIVSLPESLTLVKNAVSQLSNIFLGLAIFFGFFFLPNRLKGNRALRFSDTFTYFIYVTHHIFILSPFSLLSLEIPLWFSILLLIFSITFSALLLMFVSNIVFKGVAHSRSYALKPDLNAKNSSDSTQ